MAAKPMILTYAGCSTCKKALAWLAAHDVAVTVRPIVEEPPTEQELAAWIPRSGKPVQKWLNTSGQSYRALGKEHFAGATDAEVARLLTRDGKLVKRPVLVTAKTVIVGFDEAAYARVLDA
ncbi:MAG: Arsenate reductase [Labilithrix sp.]|nr:Arsenate reductase [Labilithrix sp.]